MEIWDVYNVLRNSTGKTHRRGMPMEAGEYHMVVHGCVFNPLGQMLIQQRQPFKEGWPNLWDVTASGSALAGETPQQAMAREMLEEVGIIHDFEGIRPVLTINFDVGFADWFLIQRDDIDCHILRLQPEEVQAVRWASLEEILQMMHDGLFIPYEPSFIEFLFTRLGKMGCHRSV
ncbi:MAG: NUDIX domain-containing protein [Clostridia bacterium]|nr:NUDIX domain-containing protein [Clostridia bacterium]MBP3650993.1 NUDIX domain-containing protein [Clostridia bacterium]